MKSIKLKILGICLGTVLLTSCAVSYDDEGLGSVFGVGSGAIYGTSYSNYATGTLVDGPNTLIGYEVGRQTDDHYRYEGYRYDDRYGDGDGYRYGY